MHTSHYLSDHTVRGAAVLPGALFIARALGRASLLEDVRFESMQALESDGSVSLPALTEVDGRLVLRSDDDAPVIASARASARAGEGEAPGETSIPDASGDADETLSHEALYSRLARQGNDYGERFRTVVALERSGQSTRAEWLFRDGSESEERLVTLLDACTHVAAITGGLSTTYYLHGIARIAVVDNDRIADGARVIRATRTADDANGCMVDCRIEDGEGRVLVTLDGLELRRFGDAHAEERLAVAGTFTLDPLDDVATLWSRQLGLPLKLSRADYGQVFQPLLSGDSVFDETAQSHTCLVRVADWEPKRQAPAAPARERVDAALGDLSRHLLPDGRTIASLNKYESAYLYQEIFRDLAYRRHGVRVLEGDTVVDIGANIGLFTLFASQEAANVRVISVEPSPVVLPILKANAALYAPGGKVIEAGASDRIGTAQFTAYRNSSVFSSFDADEGADEEAIRQVIRNSLEAMGQEDEALLEEAVEEMIQGRMDAESFDCELIPVSEIIRREGLERIDLLKIDAEKSEDAILAGIEDAHWPLIDQLIIEVHLQGGRSADGVIALLEGHGFDVIRDEEELLEDSGLIGLYAARPERFARNAAAGEEPALREAADLFVDAAKAHAARSTVPLSVVLCPADVRDPAVRTIHESVEHDLTARLAEIPATTVLSWERFAEHYPVAHAHDTLGGALADMPYTPEWYAATGSALVRRHVASRRQAAKVLVLDCDNTLWNGVVGEVGADGVQIGPAHVALYASVRRLIGQGVLIALASKNAEADVRAVFDTRDDFPLAWSDIVAQRVNWQPKADNFVEIAAELSLGLDSFVFIDDSPMECEEMRVRLPEVLTLQFPTDETEAARLLDHVWAFDQYRVTAEDERRATMYREESRRREFREDAGSIEGFIEGLKLDVAFAPVDEERLERAAQMTQRTNQFNFTTERRSPVELRDWLAAGDARGGEVMRVTDRFGDYGITGLILYERIDEVLRVDTFLLSCRILGRGVEHRVIAELGRLADEASLGSVSIDYLPTARNEPARRFMEQLPGSREADGDGARLNFSTADAVAFTHDPTTVTAAADAAAEAAGATAAARPELPPAPSREVERVARELSSAARIAELARTRARAPRPALEEVHVAPATELEQQLAAIWQDLLGIEGIGANDGFFALGGSSLGAVQMVAEVQRTLGLSVSVVDVFDSPTIAGLARAVGSGADKRADIDDSRQRGAARRAQRPMRPTRQRRA